MPVELEAYLDEISTQAEKMRFQEPAKAVRLCMEGLEKVKTVQVASRPLKNQIARLNLNLSNLYIRLSAYDKALSHALSAHEIYQDINLSSGIARSLNIIGLAHLQLNAFANALDYLLQAQNLAAEMKDTRLMVRVLNNLGTLYLQMEEYNKALNYLQQGEAISEKHGLQESEANLFVNICVACLHLGKFSQALSHGQKGIGLYRLAQNKFGEANALSTLGEVYAAMGHHIEALNSYQKALEIFTSIEYAQGVINNYYLIGMLELNQGEMDTALSYFEKALFNAEKEHTTAQTYRIHHALYTIYRELAEYEKALAHFEKFHEAKETVFNEDMTTKIKSLEIMHNVRETEQDSEIYRLKNVELTREIEERKKIQAELERIATLDPLTGLYNRRHFFELTQQELERSRRYNRPLSVIMLDIDHFKQVNDQFGHLVGDRVIVEVSRRIQKALRRIDLACRYGGEEFAILLPETSLRQAEMVATRLWQLITRQPTVSGELKLTVTVSVGVATYQMEGMITVDMLLDRSDKAMYAAKAAGRNQVIVFTKEMNSNKNNFY